MAEQAQQQQQQTQYRPITNPDPRIVAQAQDWYRIARRYSLCADLSALGYQCGIHHQSSGITVHNIDDGEGYRNFLTLEAAERFLAQARAQALPRCSGECADGCTCA